MTVRQDQRIAAADIDAVALHGIAVGIFAQHVVDRIPGTDIVPVGGERNHPHSVGLLHDAVVDRNVRHPAKLAQHGLHRR